MIVLITGASSGIGKALANECLKRGHKVALLARRLPQLNEFLRNHDPDSVLICEGDVAKEEDLKKAVTRTIEKFGRLDMAVANAGIGVIGPFLKLKPEDFERQFATNIGGVLNTCRAVLPELLKTKGTLGLVGSVMSYVNMAGDSPYTMSKAAVRALADTLYLEMKPLGVHVTHIAPGLIESEIRLKNNQGQMIQGGRDEAPAFLVMPAEKAAKQILRALENRKREIVVTRHGKFAVFMRQKLPWVYFQVVSRIPVRGLN